MLPTKQRLFVSAYVKSRNATHAAIEAGYNKKWAGTNADKLLKNTNIAAAINEQLKAIEARSLITAERVLQEYARLAFFDPRKLFNDDGSPKGIHALDDDTAAAIVGIKVVSVGNAEIGIGKVLEYKIANKNGALDSLARTKGMFNDKVNLGDESIRALLALVAGSGSDILSRVRDGGSSGN